MRIKRGHTIIGPLQLDVHLVQNRHAQMGARGAWEQKNPKEITSPFHSTVEPLLWYTLFCFLY